MRGHVAIMPSEYRDQSISMLIWLAKGSIAALSLPEHIRHATYNIEDMLADGSSQARDNSHDHALTTSYMRLTRYARRGGRGGGGGGGRAGGGGGELTWNAAGRGTGRCC